MEYREFIRHVQKAGLTLGEFAALMSVHRGSISNHAKTGKIPDSYAVAAVLLGDYVDRGMSFRELLARFNMKVGNVSEKVARIEDYRSGKRR